MFISDDQNTGASASASVFPQTRRGSQGASRTAPGKSGLHARGEGERVLSLESREGTILRQALGGAAVFL